MKINVRHEAATEAGNPPGSEATEQRSVVWITGDDGETVDTRWLDPGEETSIDVGVQAEGTGKIGATTRTSASAPDAEAEREKAAGGNGTAGGQIDAERSRS